MNYCCITNHPKNCYVKPTIISLVHKSVICAELNSEGSFLLHMMSTEVTQLGAGRSSPKMAYLMAGKLMLAVSWELSLDEAQGPLFMSMWISASPWKFGFLTTWWPDSRANVSRKPVRSVWQFYDLPWESHSITSAILYWSSQSKRYLPTPEFKGNGHRPLTRKSVNIIL